MRKFLRRSQTVLSNPYKIFAYMNRHFPFEFLDDETFLKLKYRSVFGRSLDLKSPKTYNEKLQWLKLYDRNPLYITLVDKYEAKKYVAKLIGEQYIIPTLGVWDAFEAIDFNSLPDQFVLKCTHDSGGIVVCTDKNNFDYDSANIKLSRCLKNNFFWKGREWPYKDVKPRIIAEKYMVDEVGYGLRDYKFFCFDGKPKLMYIASDRQNKREDTKFDFFDMDFNSIKLWNEHLNSVINIDMPETFDMMKELCLRLTMGIPHVRVDFYTVNGQVYFGEFTFFHSSGFTMFEPEEWDYKLGEYLSLPMQNEETVSE